MVWLAILMGATALAQPRAPYPAHWWARVPADQKASWEILPQAAQAGRSDSLQAQ